MDDNILTKPLLQNAELITLAPRTVTLVPGAWTQIMQQQAQRMTATILRQALQNLIMLAPFPFGSGPLPAALAVPYPFHLHAAEWPLEITGPWFAFTTVGMDVMVYETLRYVGD